MRNVKVSLIIPAYNVEKYIEENIRSIRAQDYDCFEAIYVDDGSTDGTGDIIKKYSETDSRIKYYKQKNCGAGFARNRGMTYADGKYIMFLDADDFFHPHLLSDLVELSESGNLDISICDANIYDMRFNAYYECWNALMEEYIPDKTVFSCDDAGEGAFMISGSFPWNKMYLRSFINKNHINFQEINSINDLYFVFMTFVKANRVSICKSKLVYYRMGSQEGLTINNDKEPDNIYKAYKKLKDSLVYEGLYEKYYKALCRMFTWDLFTALHRMRSFDKFDYLYNRIKNVYLPEFDITNKGREYYLDDYMYSRYLEIVNCSSGEYVFNVWRERTTCDDDKTLFEIEKTYLFKNYLYKYGSRLIIYGFGKVGKDLVEQIISLGPYLISAIIDNNCQLIEYKGIDIINKDELLRYDFDYIIVAILNPEISSSIIKDLSDMGIRKEKIRHFL